MGGGVPFVHLHFHDNNVFKFVLITSYPDSQIWYTRKKNNRKTCRKLMFICGKKGGVVAIKIVRN